jgi:hypothetical protein
MNPAGFNLARTHGWKNSPKFGNYHKVCRLGAFAKWAREHPEEKLMVEERARREREEREKGIHETI